MNIDFRPEEIRDESFLRSLLTAAVIEELGAEAWPEPLRTHLVATQSSLRLQAVRSHFPDGESRIVLIDGEAAGWLYLARLPGELRLVEILLAGARRNRGAGTAVLKNVIEAAAGKPVRLYVNVMNVRATRFYERLGFRRIEGDEVQHFMERPAEIPC
jgi:ribosomal protein S18 acetylase RimI-like enzyme